MRIGYFAAPDDKDEESLPDIPVEDDDDDDDDDDVVEDDDDDDDDDVAEKSENE
jgi:hypothetical protein